MLLSPPQYGGITAPTSTCHLRQDDAFVDSLPPAVANPSGGAAASQTALPCIAGSVSSPFPPVLVNEQRRDPLQTFPRNDTRIFCRVQWTCVSIHRESTVYAYLQAASYLGVFCMCVFVCPCRILCPQSDTGNAFWPGLARRGFPQRGGPLLQPGVLHLLGGMMMSHGCSLWFLLHSFPCFFLYVCNYFGPF